MITLSIQNGGNLIAAEGGPVGGFLADVLRAVGAEEISNTIAETAVAGEIRRVLDQDGVIYTMDTQTQEQRLTNLLLYVAGAFLVGYLIGRK